MKKGAVIMMLCFTFTFAITGCQSKETQKLETEVKDNQKVQETQQPEEVPMETQTQDKPEEVISKLTEEELDWFENSFFNTEDNPIVNMFLTSEYTSADDINLSFLFYRGIGTEGSSQISQEELQLLKEQYEDITEVDVFKITAEEMDAILQKYTGLTLEETNRIGLENLYYLEEYQSYYALTGDDNYVQYHINYGWKNEDGIVMLEYTHDKNYSSDENLHSVTLKEVDGTYRFVSNETVK